LPRIETGENFSDQIVDAGGKEKVFKCIFGDKNDVRQISTGVT